ncbi:MAG TPA: hypothetical protein VMG14_08370 [Thermoplasmata archaeon]|jgi:hypothetical protein|nr:hypothetical protein [Thermoplasmata archaeon]
MTAPIPASAPDLVGPVSILDWPLAAAGPGRRKKPRPLAHAHLEIDLRHERYDEPSVPVLRQFERLFREREVVEPADLLRLSAGALHGLASLGFTRVDHWEIQPGGWLALPEPTHRAIAEPVGHLLRALSSDQWQPHAGAREFAVRLSGPPRMQADLVVRRVHRERGHSISVDLTGTFAERDLLGLVRALRERVPVLRSRVTAFRYAAPDRSGRAG